MFNLWFIHYFVRCFVFLWFWFCLIQVGWLFYDGFLFVYLLYIVIYLSCIVIYRIYSNLVFVAWEIG